MYAGDVVDTYQVPDSTGMRWDHLAISNITVLSGQLDADTLHFKTGTGNNDSIGIGSSISVYGQIGDKFLIWWSSENLNDCNSRKFSSTEEWEQYYNFFFHVPDISDFHGQDGVPANFNYIAFWLNYQSYDIGRITTWVIDSTHGANETVIVNDSGMFRRLLLDLGYPYAPIDFDKYFLVFYREFGIYPGPYSSGGVPWPRRNITLKENNSEIAVILTEEKCVNGCAATLQYIPYDSTRYGTYYSVAVFPKPAETKSLFSIKRTVTIDGMTGKTVRTDYEGAIYSGKVRGTEPIKIEQPGESRYEGSLNVFPNPFNHSTTVMVDLKGEEGPVKLQVFDITGKLVKSFYHVAKSKHLTTFDASGLPAGVYLIKARAGSKILKKKLFLSK